MMQSRPALACVLGAIFGAVALAAVPREASTAAAPGRRLSGEIASRAAACYAKRYPDLKCTFCKSDGACNAPQAMKHFRDHGRREGRLFGCDGEANGTAPALESSCGRDIKPYDDEKRRTTTRRTRTRKRSQQHPKQRRTRNPTASRSAPAPSRNIPPRSAPAPSRNIPRE